MLRAGNGKQMARVVVANRAGKETNMKLTIRRKNGKASVRLRIWKLAITVEFPS